MLDASPLEPGERFASIEEIRDCNDVASMIVTPYFETSDGSRTPYWTRADGSPLKIKVRGFGAKLQHDIRKEAGDDDYVLMIETCFHGIAEPSFSRDQLAIFERKHPGALATVADTIWGLSEFPAQWFETALRAAIGDDPKDAST
jgi:hypothetical protein